MENKVLVHGLGYVGLATSLGLAQNGLEVYATDLDEKRLADLNAGKIDFSDDSLGSTFHVYRKAIRFILPHRLPDEISTHIICVGTPPLPNGDADLSQLQKVISDLNNNPAYQTMNLNIILRSTVPPGTCTNIENEFGKQNNWELFHFPEFLREGHAMLDFNDPPMEVIGYGHRKSRLKKISALLISDIGRSVRFEESELLKYICNAFHALKICFANEVASLARNAGVNSDRLMDTFCKDTKLNISRAYLKPGFSFGGICLEKDLLALGSFALKKQINTPLLNSILQSNQVPFENTINSILKAEQNSVLGISGIAFKPNTGDIRFSKILEIAHDPRIRRHFKKVLVYDDNVVLSKLPISDFINFSQSPEELIESSDTVVLGSKELALTAAEIHKLKQKLVVDLRFFTRQSHIIQTSNLTFWSVT